jgi:protein dithiol oxidoreductase (disulfide-forming)
MHTMKWLKTIFAATATMFAIGAMAQADRDVVQLKNPQPVEGDGKIEVIEFFGYGCIHCAQLEPKLEQWIKRQSADVRVKRVPVEYASKGVESIPIYYTLEAMGLQEKLHQKIFDAVHVENVIVANPAAFNKWLEKQGVDPAKYEEVKRSFSVADKSREKNCGGLRDCFDANHRGERSFCGSTAGRPEWCRTHVCQHRSFDCRSARITEAGGSTCTNGTAQSQEGKPFFKETGPNAAPRLEFQAVA